MLSIRNLLYNAGFFGVYQSSIKTIGIGNLSVGGTGKTPFTAYLIEKLLASSYNIAVVSRGYGRKTNGLREVTVYSKATDVGDEPLLLKLRYPTVHIWVSEKRVFGIKEAEKQDVDVILLDDNFQHRSIGVNYQFMLSNYKRPFFQDVPMPSGTLREFRRGAKRADCIIYTASPNNYGEAIFNQKTHVYTKAEVHFAQHNCQPLKWISNPIQNLEQIIAVSGIANPSGFITHCKTISTKVATMTFTDHKNYTLRDKDTFIAMYNRIKTDSKALICTEKDWVKLKELFTHEELQKISCAYVPVEIEMLTSLDINHLIKTL